MKKCTNSLVVENLLGALSTGPRPPARLVIHQSSSSPTPSMKGAAIPSKNLIISIPRQITYIFSAQNAKKQTQTPIGDDPAAGHRIRSIAKIAWPPIHV